MKLTIIGAGNTGLAAAVYLKARGCDVLVYTRSRKKAQKFQKESLLVTGAYSGTVWLHMTDSLEEAAEYGDYILIFTWANAHREVFDALRGNLKARQKILIFNGNWGAYEAVLSLGEEIREKDITLGETTSQVFLAELQEEMRLHMKAVKQTITLSGLDKTQTETLAEDWKLFFRTVIAMESVVATSLSAGNPIIHVPLSLFHITRLENGEDYYFLGQASERAVRYVEHMDKERRQIGAFFGIRCKGILEELNSFWEGKYASLYEMFHENPMYCKNRGPVSLDSRFLQEDIPFGTHPVCQLGRLCKTDISYTKAAEQMLGLYLEQDFTRGEIAFDMHLLELLTAGDWGKEGIGI